MPYKNREDRIAQCKRYRDENRDKLRNEQSILRKNRRQSRVELLGGKCVQCGCNENLDFDHKNPGTKQSTVSYLSLGEQGCLELKDDFQLLCRDCHHNRSSAQKRAAWQLFISLPLYEQERLIQEQHENHS